MTDEQKAVYAEAGHWVRLANLAIWGSSAVFLPMTLTPAYLALTTNLPRSALAAVSIVIGLFWLYFDHRYNETVKAARQILADIENLAMPLERRFYQKQDEFLESHVDITLLFGCFVFAIVIYWLAIFMFPTAPIAPLK